MVTSSETLRKIREIIDKHYSAMIVSALGAQVLSDEEVARLRDQGMDVDNRESLLELIYNHNFINNPLTPNSPTSVEDMISQQSQPGIKPEGEAHNYAIESLNENTRQIIEKLKEDVKTRVEGIVRQNNDRYKMNALQNLDRSDIADRMVKESSLGEVKRMLRDTSGDANRDWQRVALTEMSNAIGAGSVDRIVSNNPQKDLNEVYVYRIIVGDSLTCKHCRRFYGDVGQSPKLYKLSTLLGNGSNYGKKQDEWKPVVGATHPNTRTSQIIELKPGFMVQPGGSVTFIGLDKWQDYINSTLVS